MATPIETHHYGELGSTQDEAGRLANGGSRLPLLVVADRQTSGRGRSGSSWKSAPRALACSLAVSPGWDPPQWTIIPLLAGLAAKQALGALAGVESGLKWPNDLVSERGKVGGILVESGDGIAVVGVGINLWWPDAPAGFGAVHDDDPGPEAAMRLGRAAAAYLVEALDGEPSSWDRDGYKAACLTLGSEVTWEPAGRGRAVDIAVDGGLVVDTGTGREILRSGEVRSVRTATLRSATGLEREGTTE